MTDHDTIYELDEDVLAELVACLTKAVQIIDHHTLGKWKREDGVSGWVADNRAARAQVAIEDLLWEVS